MKKIKKKVKTIFRTSSPDGYDVSLVEDSSGYRFKVYQIIGSKMNYIFGSDDLDAADLAFRILTDPDINVESRGGDKDALLKMSREYEKQTGREV